MIKLDRSDYVLGTHDQEIVRLGTQHRLWRDYAHEAWRQAGIRPGSRVLDLGAGPGFAARDLAKVVGSTGKVYGAELSPKFLNYARQQPAAEGSAPIDYFEVDLMGPPLPSLEIDAVWCRWVSCFVSSPKKLLSQVQEVLKTGGRVVFHEFAAYDTWRFLGHYPSLNTFVSLVMESWRKTGGEPNIGRDLPELLVASGYRILEANPYVFCLSPADEMWKWPTSFIDTNLERLVDLGVVEEKFREDALREFRLASSIPTTRMMTPVLLEVIAEKL